VQSYWDARALNKAKQLEAGKIDAGTRSEVTGGAQMGAMEVLVADILCDAGLNKLDVKTRTALELPGYYRAEKKWDLIVLSNGQLVTAMELNRRSAPPSATISITAVKRPSEVQPIFGSRSARAG